MRTVNETKTIYSFDDLTGKLLEKAVEKAFYINVEDPYWYECIYDDAAEIGFKIIEFDLGRGSCVKGRFLEDPLLVARKILKTHGIHCETYKTAAEFIETMDNLEDTEEKDRTEYYFLEEISDCYYYILMRQYDYLTSKEAILETLETNEYEFLEDGSIY